MAGELFIVSQAVFIAAIFGALRRLTPLTGRDRARQMDLGMRRRGQKARPPGSLDQLVRFEEPHDHRGAGDV